MGSDGSLPMLAGFVGGAFRLAVDDQFPLGLAEREPPDHDDKMEDKGCNDVGDQAPEQGIEKRNGEEEVVVEKGYEEHQE